MTRMFLAWSCWAANFPKVLPCRLSGGFTRKKYGLLPLKRTLEAVSETRGRWTEAMISRALMVCELNGQPTTPIMWSGLPALETRLATNWAAVATSALLAPELSINRRNCRPCGNNPPVLISGWVSGNRPGKEIDGAAQVIALDGLRCLLFQIGIIAAGIGIKNKPAIAEANAFFLETLEFERQFCIHSSLLLCHTCGSSILLGSIQRRSHSSAYTQ